MKTKRMTSSRKLLLSIRSSAIFAVVVVTACSPQTGVTKPDSSKPTDAQIQEMRALFDRCELTRRQMTQAGSMNPPSAEMTDAMDRCHRLLNFRTLPAIRFW